MFCPIQSITGAFKSLIFIITITSQDHQGVSITENATAYTIVWPG